MVFKGVCSVSFSVNHDKALRLTTTSTFLMARTKVRSQRLGQPNVNTDLVEQPNWDDMEAVDEDEDAHYWADSAETEGDSSDSGESDWSGAIDWDQLELPPIPDWQFYPVTPSSGTDSEAST